MFFKHTMLPKKTHKIKKQIQKEFLVCKKGFYKTVRETLRWSMNIKMQLIERIHIHLPY